MTLKLGMQHQGLEYYQVCLNDDPGLTLIFLRQSQIWFLMLLYGEKGKTMDFSETIVASKELSAPAPGPYTCIK